MEETHDTNYFLKKVPTTLRQFEQPVIMVPGKKLFLQCSCTPGYLEAIKQSGKQSFTSALAKQKRQIQEKIFVIGCIDLEFSYISVEDCFFLLPSENKMCH